MPGRSWQRTAARWFAIAVLLPLPALALVGLAPQAAQGLSFEDPAIPDDAISARQDAWEPVAALTEEPSVLLNGWGYTGHKAGHHVPPGQAKKIPESKHASPFIPGPNPPGHKPK
jgi:hypothetical protein